MVGRTGCSGDSVILNWLLLVDPFRKGHFCVRGGNFLVHLGQGLS